MGCLALFHGRRDPRRLASPPSPNSLARSGSSRNRNVHQAGSSRAGQQSSTAGRSSHSRTNSTSSLPSNGASSRARDDTYRRQGTQDDGWTNPPASNLSAASGGAVERRAHADAAADVLKLPNHARETLRHFMENTSELGRVAGTYGMLLSLQLTVEDISAHLAESATQVTSTPPTAAGDSIMRASAKSELNSYVRMVLLTPLVDYHSSLLKKVKRHVEKNAARFGVPDYPRDLTVRRAVNKIISTSCNSARSGLRTALWNSLAKGWSLVEFVDFIGGHWWNPKEKLADLESHVARIALMRIIAVSLYIEQKSKKQTARIVDTGFWKELRSHMAKLTKDLGTDFKTDEWEEWQIQVISDEEGELECLKEWKLGREDEDLNGGGDPGEDEELNGGGDPGEDEDMFGDENGHGDGEPHEDEDDDDDE